MSLIRLSFSIKHLSQCSEIWGGLFRYLPNIGADARIEVGAERAVIRFKMTESEVISMGTTDALIIQTHNLIISS